jgi:nucleoid DNA-binding protein
MRPINQEEKLTMVKKELIAAAAEATGYTEKETEDIVNGAIAQITEAIQAGDTVDLHPLGRFLPVVEPEHAGTDPSTHEAIQIPEHTRILFHPSQVLKDAAN